MKHFLTILALIALVSAAQAFGLGEGNRFGKLGAGNGHGVVMPQPNGKILLVDGVSFILQTNGTSKICRAGGC